jgi:lipopolysaccharide export LptBFGC system permease protein LptF
MLATANREADRLERAIRHWPAATTALNRRWVIGTNGDVYHYDFFDQTSNRFTSLIVFGLDQDSWRLRSVTRAQDAVLVGTSVEDGRSTGIWKGRQGWIREVPAAPRTTVGKAPVRYLPFDERELDLEPPAYFKTEEPIAELMTYRELRDYIDRLRASGVNVVPLVVELQRKLAFPLVTVVMTLLAVPFAVTTGRRGAMYGIGVGIVLAIVYWVTLSLLAALGKGGLLPPLLAAWAPNMLFTAAAVYGLLTVRT